MEALRDISVIMRDSDVSAFEVIHSGLVAKLLQYLTLQDRHLRDLRIRRFLHVFLACPVSTNFQLLIVKPLASKLLTNLYLSNTKSIVMYLADLNLQLHYCSLFSESWTKNINHQKDCSYINAVVICLPICYLFQPPEVTVVKDHPSSTTSPIGPLVNKLMSCMHHLEQVC